jgi:riboflavin synthase
MEGMFTGIVEEVGTIKGFNRNSLSIKAGTVLIGTKIGDSIAVNGVCLTVTSIEKTGFSVEVMPETKKLTNIGSLNTSDRVNLERALPAQGRFGGHFVQGHVDGTGILHSMTPEGAAIIVAISAPEEILKYIVKKGFIAVNGVSLTVIDNNSQQFSFSLVTHTRNNTNLGMLKQGNAVNLEVDIIAKYIEKFYQPNKQEGIISLLDKYDYLKAR